MTASLSGLFRSLFPAIVALFCLAVLGGAGMYMAQTGDVLLSLVLVFAGLALVVAMFGLVAVQIENNVLLERIAYALEEGVIAGSMPDEVDAPAQVMPQGRQPQVPVAPARPSAPAAPAPRGRVEPVVTLRASGVAQPR
ncbi:MAG: hypothetical protein WAK98_04215 [Gemmobacter sp.]